MPLRRPELYEASLLGSELLQRNWDCRTYLRELEDDPSRLGNFVVGDDVHFRHIQVR
jgi:hypothetical protein